MKTEILAVRKKALFVFLVATSLLGMGIGRFVLQIFFADSVVLTPVVFDPDRGAFFMGKAEWENVFAIFRILFWFLVLLGFLVNAKGLIVCLKDEMRTLFAVKADLFKVFGVTLFVSVFLFVGAVRGMAPVSTVLAFTNGFSNIFDNMRQKKRLNDALILPLSGTGVPEKVSAIPSSTDKKTERTKTSNAGDQEKPAAPEQKGPTTVTGKSLLAPTVIGPAPGMPLP